MNISKKLLFQLVTYFSLLIFFLSSSIYAQNTTGVDQVASDAKVEQPPRQPKPVADLVALYPPGAINTLAAANRAGEDVAKARSAIDALFASEQKECFPKFFTTSCLAEAKERHRAAMAQIRMVEIEATKFKRRANVQERDKALAGKREKEAADLLSRSKEVPAQAADKSPEIEQQPTGTASESKPSIDSVEKRVEEHRTTVTKRQASEAENEKQRTSNIAAFEKKAKESEARQRDLEAKKLEKERAQMNKNMSEVK